MLVNELKNYGAPEALIKTLISAGLNELNPPQALSLEEGLLMSNDSFVVAAPTASGKTLIAEMAALKVFFEKRGKVIYLVPLRALAREKYEDFSHKYTDIGMRITQSTGDYDSDEPWLLSADLIIATNEKMDSLIRHHAPWLRDVSLVVADEIHLIGDGGRGPTLEVVLTRLRSLRHDLRVIALSATIPNASEIARWLNARLVQSDWRPVPLREGVYSNGAVIFNDGVVKWVSALRDSDVTGLALDTVDEGGQALVFVNTRKATEAVAKRISEAMKNREKDEEISTSVLKASAEPTRLCRKLAEYAGSGVAFHHAGINYSQRKLIEDAFRSNRIKVIAATTTLAMGINLPSRRVIIRDWWRYESGAGMQPIPQAEIKQMSGRAGRPGFDTYGEAVLIARNKRDEKYLFEKYITGKPETIDSQLGNESALRTHVLASVAGGFTRNREELVEFLKGTFFALQKGADYLYSIANDIVRFLEAEGMVVPGRTGGLEATRFGRRVSELYIDPLTGVILRDCLHHPAEKNIFSLLHMIVRTPDMMSLSLKKKDYDEMLDVFNGHRDELLIPEDEKYPSEDILSELKTASVIMQWILETHEDTIVGHFGIGPGDLRNMVDLTDWLLYSSSEICKVFNLKDALKGLSIARARVSYGVKEELIGLVSLKGIGRIRGRNLFNAGFKTLKDIKEAKVEDLAKVPTIGAAIAEDIKRQVLGSA